MIGHERPCKTGGLAFWQDIAEPVKEIVPVGIFEENLSPIDSPHNDVMQRPRGIYAGFSWHVSLLSNLKKLVNRISEERPLRPSFGLHNCMQGRHEVVFHLSDNRQYDTR